MITEKTNNLILYGTVMAVIVCCQGCMSKGRSADVMGDPANTLDAYDWQTYVGDKVGLWVSIERQELLLIDKNQVVKRYVCSTARAGIGNKQDSGKTPLGWHRVGAKIGDGLPAGALLKDREWDGQVWSEGQTMDKDLILSRILRLEGLEEGKNRGSGIDSWERYIYIHGTNQIGKLGRPASAGCVRLDPQEVIDLYDRVNEDCCVLITKE